MPVVFVAASRKGSASVTEPTTGSPLYAPPQRHRRSTKRRRRDESTACRSVPMAAPAPRRDVSAPDGMVEDAPVGPDPDGMFTAEEAPEPEPAGRPRRCGPAADQCGQLGLAMLVIGYLCCTLVVLAEANSRRGSRRRVLQLIVAFLGVNLLLATAGAARARAEINECIGLSRKRPRRPSRHRADAVTEAPSRGRGGGT